MKTYDCVIIGAGNGGMSAACQMALAGKKILLVEKHNMPGGCASSFIRGRFEFDASLHEFCDWGSEDDMGDSRRLIETVYGIDIPWKSVPTAYRVIGKSRSGREMDVVMPDGVENYIDAIEQAVPGSRPSLETFFAVCEETMKALAYISQSGGQPDSKYLQSEFPNFLRTAAYPFNEVCRAMKIPVEAQDIINTYWPYLGCDCETLSFMHYCLCVYKYIRRGAYIPEKTVHQLSNAMIERIRELGGEIWFHTKATEILFEGDQICGVRTTAGDVATKYVISNAYPSMVYGNMVPKNLVPERQKKLNEARHESMRFFNIYLGLNRSIEELGIKDYAIFNGRTMDSVQTAKDMCDFKDNDYNIFVCYNVANPDFSPEGTCAVTLLGIFRKDVWADVAIEDYYKKKEEYALRLIESFEKKTGIHLQEYIEEIEIATPWTFARYLGTPKGTCYGYDNNEWDGLMARLMSIRSDLNTPHLYFGCAADANSNGYNMTYVGGSTAAKLCLADMAKEVQ